MHANGEKERRQASLSSSADQKASEIKRDMKEGLVVMTSQAERVLCLSTCKQEVQNDLTVLYQPMLWCVPLNSLAISDLLVEGPVSAVPELGTRSANIWCVAWQWTRALTSPSSSPVEWKQTRLPCFQLVWLSRCCAFEAFSGSRHVRLWRLSFSPNWLLEGQRCALFIDSE